MITSDYLASLGMHLGPSAVEMVVLLKLKFKQRSAYRPISALRSHRDSSSGFRLNPLNFLVGLAVILVTLAERCLSWEVGMSKRLIATALVVAGVALPALAQTSTAPANPPVATSPASPSVSFIASGPFMTEQSANQWRASKLVGVDVFGADNQRIGDINEVLLNKDGMAEAVVIGVGGFLGMGEKNVAVPFKSLEWTTEPRATTGTMVPDTTGSTTRAPVPGTTGTTTGAPAPGTTAIGTGSRADPATVEARQGYPIAPYCA